MVFLEHSAHYCGLSLLILPLKYFFLPPLDFGFSGLPVAPSSTDISTFAQSTVDMMFCRKVGFLWLGFGVDFWYVFLVWRQS